MKNNMNLSKRDKQIIWHPFTQEKTALDPIAIKKALGSYLYDEAGNAYLDLISSWWVNLHGHAHPKIAEAIFEQAKTLEHVIFAGFTHEPAVNLCERIKEILPLELNKFFFSDNGSTSVEIALKMAYQYWRNLGAEEKTIFLSFEGGYHGDTFGAMSVGAKSGFHTQFESLFFDVFHVPYPDCWSGDTDIVQKEQMALACLKDYLIDHKAKIAAFILEPLVQGASGMRMCRPEFLKAAIELAKSEGILIIFDEIMTGFGRTGTNFAFEHIGFTPDFLCLSKGLTGGFLPLALTITHTNIYDAFLDDDFQKAFAHGHSYTANPLACRAGLASMDLLGQEECKNSIKEIARVHQNWLPHLQEECQYIEKIRQKGTIAAFDVKNQTKEQIFAITKNLLKEGLLLRPLGNTFYILPPYSTTKKELEECYQKLLSNFLKL